MALRCATGVGGVGDVRAVKCLHAHVAHALAHPGYAFGRAVLAEVEDPWCDDASLRGLRAFGGGDAVRVAVVDLGTNTCRLFLAQVGDAGEVAARTRV